MRQERITLIKLASDRNVPIQRIKAAVGAIRGNDVDRMGNGGAGYLSVDQVADFDNPEKKPEEHDQTE